MTSAGAGCGADPSTSSGRLTRSDLLNTSTHEKLSHVDATLGRIADLANQLGNDPDGHVRRSAAELRAAFATRGAIEPAVARLRHSVDHALGLDRLADVIVQDLLPDLRRLGFDL